MTQEPDEEKHRQRLLEENRRLAQRCLELEAASRRQLDKLRTANAILNRGEADIRSLLESADVGFALTDLNFRIASCNRTLASMIGYATAEMVGVNFTRFVYVGKIPVFNRLASRNALRESGAVDSLIEMVSKDGGLVPCRFVVTDWIDENGALQGYFLLTFSASAELQTAGRLRELEEAVAEAEKSRTLFVEVVSRELRSPASGVVGMSRMLMDAGLDEHQQELAGVIHSSAASLVRLVDDLVDTVDLDPEEVRAAPEPVCPADLARGAANLFGVRAEEKGLELRVHVAADVPDRVMLDPHLLRRVLAHLMDNSLKFTERGHVSLLVDILETRIRFMVSDTGAGVEPAVENELFRPGLTPNPSATRRHGGIGVGLAICRRLVAAMGGVIGYESELGRGSEFHFSLPLVRAERDSDTRRIVPPPEALRLPPLSVLVADGNPMNGAMIQACMRFDGHRVALTDNGPDAAEKRRTGTYDLVLLDVNLPKLDGMQTLRIVREDEKERGAPRVPVLLMSSQGQMRQEDYYLRAGADGVIRKPVRILELMDAAARATGVKPLSIARAEPPGQYAANAGGGSIRRLDGAQLVNLGQVMPRGQFMGIMRFFLEDAVPKLLDLKSRAENPEPDHARIAFSAAKARGLAGFLGFVDLAELLGRLEGAGRTEAPPGKLAALADELPQIVDDSLEELRRILPDTFATISDMRGPSEEF